MSKLKENALCVLPILAIVLFLHLTIAPIAMEALIRFAIGCVLVTFGLSLFLLGAEIGILPMGEMMGSALSKKGSALLISVVGLLMGFCVTLAEPDLQVLAGQVFEASGGEVPKTMLVAVVSSGAGFFVMAGMLRTLFNISLKKVLLVSYIVVFFVAAFASKNFLSVGFDAGGVTTGPMTVPFVLALGLGVAAVRGGSSSHDDSFGLVALMSVGPILAVLLTGVIYQ